MTRYKQFAMNRIEKSSIVAFDLDGVLCSSPGPESEGVKRFDSCVPNQHFISLANRCHDEGLYVVIYTARGMSIYNNDVAKCYQMLYQLTLNQLVSWGVKFHQLVLGKILYGVLIDDRAIRDSQIKSFQDVKDLL